MELSGVWTGKCIGCSTLMDDGCWTWMDCVDLNVSWTICVDLDASGRLTEGFWMIGSRSLTQYAFSVDVLICSFSICFWTGVFLMGEVIVEDVAKGGFGS